MMANTGNRASPQWRALYEAAVLELDHSKLLLRIAEAKHAIMALMEDLNRSEGSSESEALINALNALRVLHKLAASEGQS